MFDFGIEEYAYAYKVNEKIDVYSFGVVLMELVTGKRPAEQEFGESMDIVQWIYSRLGGRECKEIDLVDSRIPEAAKEDAAKALRIAIHCTTRVPALRPSMKMVVQMLEKADPCKLSGIVVNTESKNCKNKEFISSSSSSNNSSLY